MLYTLFSVGVLIYGSVLIGAMSPGEIDIAVTSTYLRLETLAFMMGIIVSFANAVFVVIGKAKNVYIFLAVRMALSLVADLFADTELRRLRRGGIEYYIKHAAFCRVHSVAV